MSSPKIDVLVVGAGPVGLVGALALAQSGLSIRVIDKASNFAIGQRGSGLMPRTQEAYLLLGILNDYLEKGSPGGIPMRVYDADGKPVSETPMGTRTEKTAEIPFPNPIILGQDSNCAILRKHLNALGVDVQINTELLTFEQDDTGVTATVKVGEHNEIIRAKFLLGADGAKGPTRRIAGIRFEGKTEEITAIIGDVELSSTSVDQSTLDRGCWHRFADEKRNTLVVRPVPEKDGLFFFVIGGPDVETKRVLVDVDYMHEQIRQISKRPDLVVAKIHTLAEWRLNERVADHFMAGNRVIIAGDAAHCHSPTGGQGINSGVLDVMNMSWKLALVAKGLSPLSLLQSYEEERMPVIREMLRMTTNLADKTFKSEDSSAWDRPLSLRQLGVHYRWSSIVVDELREGELVLTSTNIEPEDVYGLDTPNRLHAGDRAPDAPELLNVKTGESTQLFQLFKPTHHTIIVFDPAVADDVLALTSAYADDSVRLVLVAPGPNANGKANTKFDAYTDTHGHAHRAYSVELGVKMAIIRPDGVVGALLKGFDGITSYFAKVFT